MEKKNCSQSILSIFLVNLFVPIDGTFAFILWMESNLDPNYEPFEDVSKCCKRKYIFLWTKHANITFDYSNCSTYFQSDACRKEMAAGGILQNFPVPHIIYTIYSNTTDLSSNLQNPSPSISRVYGNRTKLRTMSGLKACIQPCILSKLLAFFSPVIVHVLK